MNNCLKDKYSRLEVGIYVICWLLVFLIPMGLEAYNLLSGQTSAIIWPRVLNAEWVLALIFLLFLLNNFVLLPQLFFKKRKVWYFLALIACFAILWWVQSPPMPPHAEQINRPDRPHIDMFHITNLIIELCVVLANFAIKVYVQSMRRDMLMLNIQNEKMQSELESLKYQISPHFLMNTLNNIQSLIESDPSRAYFTIQGLSRMMRYLLYENNASTVSLQKEVDFMTTFIDLMKIRYPEHVQVSAQFPVECEGVQVPPLLFISFLENAFKHGVSLVDESFVSVNLALEHGHLIFRCANSNNAKRGNGTTERRGIGIENVRRRLDLIYGKDYQLDITQQDKVYMVEIELPLKAGKEVSHD